VSRFTASKAGLAAICLHWAREDVETHSEPPSPALERGSAVHADIAAAMMRKPTSGLWTEQVARATSLIETLDHCLYVYVEPAFAYDPETDSSRFLGEDIGREYEKHGAKQGEICGSADVVLNYGHELVVIDWKTGNSWDDFNTKHSGQLRMLGLMAARAFDAHRVTAYVCNVDSGDVASYELDVLDLDAQAAELQDMLRAIPDAEPVPGEHCRVCPARRSCKAHTLTLAAAPTWTITTAEDIRRIYPLLAVAREKLETIEKKIHGHVAAHGEVPLEGGKVLRLTTQSRTAFDKKRALALLEEKGATSDEIASCESTSTTRPFLKAFSSKGK
jgi:hypothetical protein